MARNEDRAKGGDNGKGASMPDEVPRKGRRRGREQANIISGQGVGESDAR